MEGRTERRKDEVQLAISLVGVHVLSSFSSLTLLLGHRKNIWPVKTNIPKDLAAKPGVTLERKVVKCRLKVAATKLQGSHSLTSKKFQDFSRTFQDP